jgi:hypothetical protein
MVIKKIGALLFLAFLCVGTPLVSEAKPQGFHIYVGAGTGFVMPGAVRIGSTNWEYGILYGKMLGAMKTFYFTNYWYTGIGFGFVYPAGAGMSGALGVNWPIIWGLTLRFEGAGVASYAGDVYEQTVGGLEYDF